MSKVNDIPVIDTHEHLPPLEEYRDRGADVLKEYLSHYMSSDLRSAGLSPQSLSKAIDTSLPLLQRWDLLEPFWKVCRYTGYARALDMAVKGIYGIEGIHRETIEELNEAFQRSLKPGHFRYVLKEKCGIQLSILDAWAGRFECDRSLFCRVWNPQNYVMPMPPEYGGQLDWLEQTYGITVRTIDDWMEAFQAELADNLANGIIALKFTLAYQRPLSFERVDYDRAKSSFQAASRRCSAQ